MGLIMTAIKHDHAWVLHKKFISDFWYLKVNFLVPENLLLDTSSRNYLEFKCKKKNRKYVQAVISVNNILVNILNK